VNGVTIEYEVSGVGEPLLLIMGLGGQLIHWPKPLIDFFVAQGFQVIRFDNRDSGLSTQEQWEPPSSLAMLRSIVTRRPVTGVGYTVEDMADDAAGLLAHLNIEQTHVVGISMGGMIAQELAIKHPDKVMSLCSIMSNTGDRKHGRIAPRLLASMARQGPATLETAVEDSVQTFAAFSGPHFDPEEHRLLAKESIERSFAPAGTGRQSAAIAASRDRTPHLTKVRVPTLVVHGFDDPLVQFDGGEATAKAIPNARLLAFADMHHDLPAPRLEEICTEVLRNIRRARQD